MELFLYVFWERSRVENTGDTEYIKKYVAFFYAEKDLENKYLV